MMFLERPELSNGDVTGDECDFNTRVFLSSLGHKPTKYNPRSYFAICANTSAAVVRSP